MFVKNCGLWSTALLVALGGLTGCTDSANMAEVTGKVTYRGRPLVFASVEFNPVGNGKGSIGWTDERGEYVMNYSLSQPGVLIGRHRVVLEAYPDRGEPSVPVPEEYNGQKEFVVKPGSNRFDITL